MPNIIVQIKYIVFCFIMCSLLFEGGSWYFSCFVFFLFLNNVNNLKSYLQTFEISTKLFTMFEL